MFCIYILKSKYFNHFYTGYTDNIVKRLDKHNKGSITSTKRYKPWILFYKEEFDNKIDAINREKYLKSHTGRRWLKKKFMGR